MSQKEEKKKWDKKFKCKNCKKLLSDLDLVHTTIGVFCQKCGGSVEEIKKED
jgi:transcription elongation factor Elf1